MSGRQKGSKVERDVVVTTGLDDLIATTAQQDPSFQAAAEDAESELALLRHLAKIRRRKKLSQTEVARRMETRQSAVSELEKGIVEPRLSTLQRYARVLGYHLWIFPVKTSFPQTYVDRHFHYPPPPGVPIRARQATPAVAASQPAPAEQVATIGNVLYVQFQRRETSPLGGSIADRLNRSTAA